VTRLERTVFWVYVGSTLLLLCTGLASRAVHGEIRGWWLLLHFAISPAFMLGAVGTGLLWADRCRLRWPSGAPPAGAAGSAAGAPIDNPSPMQKLTFWLVVLFSCVVIVGTLAAMLPLFGYAAQRAIERIEIYAGIALVVAFVPYAVLWGAARRGK
jgi:hypothetical protein